MILTIAAIGFGAACTCTLFTVAAIFITALRERRNSRCGFTGMLPYFALATGIIAVGCVLCLLDLRLAVLP